MLNQQARCEAPKRLRANLDIALQEQALLQLSSRERKQALETATREFLKSARSTEVQILRNTREAASKWHRELPKERRQEINQGYKEARLMGLTRHSFVDWLIDKFGK